MKNRHNDATQYSEETDGKKDELHKLIYTSGSVIKNPFCQAIIESAKTATAVNNYLIWLGWGNKIASQARAGFKIKQYYPNTWNDIRLWDPKELELNKEIQKIFRFRDKLTLGRSIKLSSHIAICGTESSIQHLPFFLKDIRYDGLLNSINANGKYNARIIYQQIHLEENLFPKYFGPELYKKPLGNGILRVLDGERAKVQQNGSFNYRTTRLHWNATQGTPTKITSQLVIIKFENKLPILCKTAEIENATDSGYERIRILIRIDHGPNTVSDNTRQIGYVEYQKTAEISEHLDMVLRIRYRLFHNDHNGYHGLIMANKEDDINQIPTIDSQHFILGTVWCRADGMSGSLHSPSKIIKNNEGSKAFQNLEKIADRMFRNGSPGDIKKMLGLNITTDRPKEFADFFC